MKSITTQIAILTLAVVSTSTMALEPISVSNSLNTIFDSSQITEVQALELSSQEMKETQGAVLPIVIPIVGGALLGVGGYALNRSITNKPWEPVGAVTSAGIGAVTGGIGGAGTSLAGGGIAGNIAWRAPTFATGQILQQIPRSTPVTTLPTPNPRVLYNPQININNLQIPR
ncbi:MAG: hypothetical protein GAK29_04704 [Acinetobacter bereziniae]|uniref:Uncharacterized protein n=1 Tax=Acinetobacter bereziniae TaxID=106648 RepID=A0A833PAM8_ACIBZ|nr:MAG: hypothetical protein GAK29_04704 [Acinetobacter bereziniae]